MQLLEYYDATTRIPYLKVFENSGQVPQELDSENIERLIHTNTVSSPTRSPTRENATPSYCHLEMITKVNPIIISLNIVSYLRLFIEVC
jgi:hypothetical protein